MDSQPGRNPASAGVGTTTVALAATLGLAAVSWVVAVGQMKGMDMGVATRLGAFGSFAAVWAWMMAAMMLPGAAPAVARRARVGGIRAVPLFIASYLAVWALVGVVVYGAYRPHGSAAAGALVIAAGVYELTPVKRRFRRRCLEDAGHGFWFGQCCVGSSVGLMAMLGIMSVTWMCVIAIIVTAQKVLPLNAAIDIPLALAVIGLGVLIVIAPESVSGLVPPM